MKYVLYHPEAELEIVEYVEFYDKRVAGLGNRFLDRLKEMEQAAQQNPDAGSLYLGNTRRYILDPFRHDLVYKSYDDYIFVFAVPHHSRHQGYWLARPE